MFLFLMFSPDFSSFLPKKPTTITWVRLAKGTGENPSPFPFKKSQGMPESTIREQKEALKEIAKDKKGADIKSVQTPVKLKEKPQESQKRINENAGIKITKDKPIKEPKIDDALARIEQQLQKREVTIEAAQIKYEGQGQSPEGTLNEADTVNAILAKYVEAVTRKVRNEWITTPKELADGQVLKTEITVNIDEGGNIVSTSYDSKSGDASFDLSAMRALERSGPFPPPPPEIKAEVVSEGFGIVFNPKSVVSGH